MSRYARQLVLPEIGPDGLDRLAQAHVLVVGAGGLGVPVLQYLAGAGLGRITLVDGDTVAEHNLHRQPLYRMDQIGQPKAQAAAAALAALNPDVTVTPDCAMLDPANAPAWVAAADIVLDCADTFAASLTLSDVCAAQGKPLITASALAFSGYVAGCCGPAPSLRAIFPDLPERGATCATAGVMGPVVGAIGALQAQMALS
ncbi:MAG: HesA/MoeB/ThiF family protein, partial [Paracoccus sp. (in: a-proteobacteria)]